MCGHNLIFMAHSSDEVGQAKYRISDTKDNCIYWFLQIVLSVMRLVDTHTLCGHKVTIRILKTWYLVCVCGYKPNFGRTHWIR